MHLKPAYDTLAKAADNIKIAVVSYFEHSCEATNILVHSPTWALGVDFLYGEENINSLEAIQASGKTLIAGVVDGRNIWKNDLLATQKLLARQSSE